MGGKLPIIGEIDVRLAHGLPGKPAEGHAPRHPSDQNHHHLGPGASAQEGQSCEQGVGAASTGRAEGIQRAREQPS